MRQPRGRPRAARLRADLPLAMLGGASLVAPAMILGQGGSWHTAILSMLVVLAAPGAAIEAVIGLVRLVLWIENDPG
ncbi:MAG TPA: hypothetical protein VE033_18535 [Acetobacteraceae bacterium]|jgi:hypothetical protein|nr:hypothetical protein [Acetobacteraceae bacterium]